MRSPPPRLVALSFAVVVASAARSATATPAYVGRVLYALGDHIPGGLDAYDTDEPSSQTAAGGQVAGAGYVTAADGTVGPPQAVLWSGPGGASVDLNPAAATAVSSRVEGTDGTRQVGYANSVNRNGNDHALLWAGTAASYVDLNPTVTLPYIDNSFAVAISGHHQVGYGYGETTGGSVHALLWTDTAASAVDLAPTSLTGFDDTYAYGVRGNQQVGTGYGTGTGQNFHALLWSGTAASAVDLNPTDLGAIGTSLLSDTTGAQQVGAIAGDATGGAFHAALWAGTPGSAVDLNPVGVDNSLVNGTNGALQVGIGYADADQVDHARLWAGTAASSLDLEAALPGSWNASDAYTVDPADTVYGVADGTYNGQSGLFAVAWSPASAVPEPTVSIATLAAVALVGRRRPRRATHPQSRAG